MATRKVRYKKLHVKTPLPVLREDQVDPSEYESLTSENQIQTGVEQAEENVREKHVGDRRVAISRALTRDPSTLRPSLHKMFIMNADRLQ